MLQLFLVYIDVEHDVLWERLLLGVFVDAHNLGFVDIDEQTSFLTVNSVMLSGLLFLAVMLQSRPLHQDRLCNQRQ